MDIHKSKIEDNIMAAHIAELTHIVKLADGLCICCQKYVQIMLPD